jgi:hypothetical protein
MKTKKIILAFSIVAIISTAWVTVNDILEKLGIQQKNAEYAIMYNLLGVAPVKPNCSGDCDPTRMIMPKSPSLQSIITGDKKGAAKELCEYIKAYVESPAFHEAYQKQRASAKPFNEQPRQIDQAYMESINKSIADMEAEAKKHKDPQTKKMYGDIIADMKRQQKEQSDPLPNTTAWKAKYPEHLDSLVVRQLNFYLSELATVDFAAQTVQKGRTKVFAKQEYERKGKTWKYIYRSGKDVNDVVKVFVKDWLKQGVKIAPYSAAATETKKAVENAVTPSVQNEASTTTSPTEAQPEKKKGLKGLKEKAKKIFN